MSLNTNFGNTVGTPRVVGPVTRPFEKRRGELEKAASTKGGVFSISGFIDVNGAGESLVDVAFPVQFIEQPVMLFGGELADNEVLVTGHFPMISVMVKSWKKEKKNGADYFVGATLIVVSSGSAKQKIKAHWKAEAKALTNPLSGLDSTNSAI